MWNYDLVATALKTSWDDEEELKRHDREMKPSWGNGHRHYMLDDDKWDDEKSSQWSSWDAMWSTPGGSWNEPYWSEDWDYDPSHYWHEDYQQEETSWWQDADGASPEEGDATKDDDADYEQKEKA